LEIFFGSFLHPYESHLSFTLVLTTRTIRTLPLLRRIVAFLSQRHRPDCKRWALVHTTQCSECTHFQWLRKKFDSNLVSLKFYQQSNAGIGLPKM